MKRFVRFSTRPICRTPWCHAPRLPRQARPGLDARRRRPRPRRRRRSAAAAAGRRPARQLHRRPARQGRPVGLGRRRPERGHDPRAHPARPTPSAPRSTPSAARSSDATEALSTGRGLSAEAVGDLETVAELSPRRCTPRPNVGLHLADMLGADQYLLQHVVDVTALGTVLAGAPVPPQRLDRPPRPAPRRRHRPAPGEDRARPAAARHRQAHDPGGDPQQARQAHRGRVGRDPQAPADRRGHARRRTSRSSSAPSSSSTTSAGTASATPTARRATRSTSSRASPRSPTSTTP